MSALAWHDIGVQFPILSVTASINIYLRILPKYPANYHIIPKISDTRKFAAITLKVEQDDFTIE